MSARVRAIVLKGLVEYRHEANRLLTEPGATVIVYRGLARAIAMACPDGCGEQLTVNLDERAGPAWRYYQQAQCLTVFPSIWRETGCRSHFIVWRSKIYWCDRSERLDKPQPRVLMNVQRELSDQFVDYVEIARDLELVPWDVLSACNLLVEQGIAEPGAGSKRGCFRLLTSQ